MPVPAVAPWVRTRLRAAPGAAVALAALVAVTAFLAALFPRAVETYENDAVRTAVADAGPARTGIELTAPAPGLEADRRAREEALGPGPLRERYTKTLKAMPAPIRGDESQSTYGARTVKSPDGLDRWLPRLDPIPPQFTVAAQAGLDRHARVREGRLPRGAGVTSDSRRVEAAVTEDTARVMKLRVGTSLHLPSTYGPRVTVRITGIVEPLRPGSGYWSYDPFIAAPAKELAPGPAPQYRRWHAGLLLAPEAGGFLPAVDQSPQRYWRVAPASDGLTTRDMSPLKARIASLEGGPLLTRLRGFTDRGAQVSTDLDEVLTEHAGLRDAVTPVVAVAAYGVGGVATVVLLMTCALSAARRHTELALLRSRGGSVRGIAGRLLAETSVVAVPAAGLGLLAAVLAVPDARVGPSLWAAAAVGALACVVLPVRAAVAHRRPRAHAGRDDVLTARPSRRRTVAELVLLVLAVGAVVTLRRRGTGDAGSAASNASSGSGASGSGSGSGSVDWLVSAAPVLVGCIAALVLVRLYPLPLRLLARPLARRRGTLGFLSMASAGRASAAHVLPLLGLLLALTTAAFGGSVLAGVHDARDRTALLTVGADARVERTDGPLPASLAAELRRASGVREVSAVHIDWNLTLPDGSSVPLVAVEPETYARLTASTGLGRLTKMDLTAARPADSAPLPAVASPGVARLLGTDTHSFRTPSGSFKAKVGPIRTTTPALPTQGGFLLIDRAGLPKAKDTTLLATGGGITRGVVEDALVGAKAGARAEAGAGAEAQAGGGARADAGARAEASARASTDAGASASADAGASADAEADAGASTDADASAEADAGPRAGAVKVRVRADARAALTSSPLQSGAENVYAAAVAAAAGYAALAVLLSLLQSAPRRRMLLGRLRTMGLSARQGRGLLALEALPQALLAAVGGVLAGWAAIGLLADGLDLRRIALAAHGGLTGLGEVTLRADPWSLLLPAAGIVVLVAGVAFAQAWWTTRRTAAVDLRTGDNR
ncbi:FtsX-like permease family protein [Streptomyces formicae]|uniref:Peptidoglycan bound protein (LPXTG motif) n=1 Tax=Streptomyces formicae TaxID=1616117 RepID=A0A291Q8N6_9ACTN|nr:FtsX-like permease family protein [Streptomyces formicae]ATL27833.1 Putative peptidoglycan bound protein (LPXTG motif) [Streptomyces formicae]